MENVIQSSVATRILNLFHAVRRAIDRFSSSDMEILSSEVKEILSDPKDAKVYLEALEEVKNSGEAKTIVLHNGKKLTLI